MRFLEMIVTPLKEIYGIPSTSVHVFYNLAGPTIAFNRDGALFLNLRYYEGWRKHNLVCSPYHSHWPSRRSASEERTKAQGSHFMVLHISARDCSESPI